MTAPAPAPAGPTPADPAFPLPAMVAGDQLVLALLLCAVDPAIGGVLLRGEKGSGKTTAARALASVLPGAAPFVELPLGATEDRVVGSLDLRAALGGGEYRFQPGLLAEAHRGVLYVDEVNLLADHLVDALLDAAATGMHRVERDGVSHAHPARFVLVGSMNPEEGELRPQLLDRFGLSVEAAAPTEAAARAEAVRRRLAFDADRQAFCSAWEPEQAELRRRLSEARPAVLAPGLEESVARLCAGSGAHGLRADLVICRAAAALAGWEGRRQAGEAEVRRVAPLALAHRRRTPWEHAGPADADLDQLLDQAFGPQAQPQALPQAQPPRHSPPTRPPGASPPGDPSPGTFSPDDPPLGDRPDDPPLGDPPDDPPLGDRPDGPAGSPPPGEADANSSPRADGREPGAPSGSAGDGRHSGSAAAESRWPTTLPPFDASSRLPLFPETPEFGGPASHRPAAPSAGAGRRRAAASRSQDVAGARGRVVGSRVPDQGAPLRSVAPVATVVAAAGRTASAGDLDPGTPLGLVEGDLREAVTRRPVPHLVVIAVDTSGSMGAESRVEAAQQAVHTLLVDAYQRRDRVAVVTFRGESAEVVLRPTSSTEIARARLSGLPTGGRTPLAEGIMAALDLATEGGGGSSSSARPGRGSGTASTSLMVIVSDGRATWAAGGGDPIGASLAAADAVRHAGVAAVVVDCEEGRTRLGLAAELARAAGGRCVRPARLTGETVAGAVRSALPGLTSAEGA